MFLTDLRGYDVVFGKLAATSLNALYGLLAILPVLAVPMLLGGITNGEFWRVVLVLVNTFLFSLTIGIFVSALSRDARKALAANFALLLLLIVGIPAIGLTISYFFHLNGPFPGSFFSCPMFSGYFALDNQYKLHKEYFWWSVGVIHGLTWLLVLLASWSVPRSWQDKPVAPRRSSKTRWRDLWCEWSYGNAKNRGPFRKRLLDINAFYWLAGRARLKPAHVWTFLGLAGCWWLWGRLATGNLWLEEPVNITMAVILNSTLKLWIALEAGQRLAEDQKIGALELLLTTPLTVRDIVRGQLLALRRQFLRPVLAVVVIELILMALSFQHSSQTEVVTTFVAAILMLAADMTALSWVAMANALSAKSLNHAIIKTISRVLILPWVGFGVVAMLANLWSALFSKTGWVPGWKFYLGWWFGLGIFIDLIYGLTARWRLQHRFRQFAMRHYVPLPSRFAWLATHLKAALSKEPEPSQRVEEPAQPGNRPVQRKRRKIIALGFSLGLVLLILCGGFLFRKSHPSYPAPLVVSVDFSKGTLRVFPGIMGAFFVLPDGSLWRWGLPEGPKFPKVALPEQVGTNSDWKQAVAAYDHCVGLRSDGTIWEWGWRGSNYFSATPEQVDAGHDWTSIAAGQRHAVAIRRDGTLWTWGENSMNQLGQGPGPAQTNLLQVGADHNWSVAQCQWASTLAVRTDGTLWLWGQVPYFGSSPPTFNNTLASPTRLCRETNWVGFATGSFPVSARTQSGELWNPFYGPPDPEASRTSTCHLILSNSAPDRVAFAFSGAPNLYEMHDDGTLWEINYAIGSMGLWNPTPTGKWHQFGKRSDWVSIWGGGGTALGLTSDGTIWMWGQDPSQDPAMDFSARLQMLQHGIKSLLGTAPAGRTWNAKKIPYQKEPRPLMRLVPAGSKSGTIAR